MNTKVFIRNYSFYLSLMILSGFLISIILSNYIPVIMIIILSNIYIIIVMIQRKDTWLNGSFGYPNIITTIRLLIILAIFFMGLYTKLDDKSLEIIVIIASILLSADKLDGILARLLNQSSEIGGYYDMEVDGYFTFLLSIILYDLNILGWWILILGNLRYIYVVITHFIPVKEAPKTDKRSNFGAVIGVVFNFTQVFALLIIHDGITTMFPFYSTLSLWLVTIFSLLIFLSFSRSFMWRIRA